MPVMDFFAGDELPIEFVIIETLSYMLFPNSESHRERYVAHRYGEYLLGEATNGAISMPSEMLAAILKDKNPKEVKEPSLSIVSKGCIAGEMLLILLELQAEGMETSVNRAAYLAEDHFWKARNAYGKRSTVTSGEKIKLAWSQYKSVSHFWAASNLAQGEDNRERWASRVVEKPGGFLSVAAKAAELATKVPQHSGKGQILAYDQLWTLPDYILLPECEWTCRGLRDSFREKINQYKSTHWNPTE